MADKVPVKATFSGTNVTVLAEFTTSGTVGVSQGGTGATSASDARTNLGLGTASTATAPSGDIVGTTDSQTLTNKTLTSPVLNGSLSGTAFLDEDNFSSNSATAVASQQSIKAYVDNNAGKHTIQKNDLEDGTDSTTSLGAKTNLLFDSNTFRVANDAGSDSTQVRLTTEFTGITNGTAAANKAVILGTNGAIANIGAMTSVGSYSGGAVTSTGTVSGTKIESSGTTATSIETSGGITLSGAITGATTISGTTINASSIDVQDTSAEAVAILHRNQTGSNGNDVGKLKFKGQNSADEEINFAQIGGVQKTVTDGSEDGQLDFNVMNGGNLNTSVTIDEDGLIIKGSRKLTFGSTQVTASANEINLLDGDTSASTPTLVDDDRVIVNDDGTMKQVALSRLKTYIGSGSSNVFKTISITGQDDVVADSSTDTLTLVGTGDTTITTNSGTDTITIDTTVNSIDGGNF